MRCNFVSTVWARAFWENPVDKLNPLNFVWIEDGGHYRSLWFKGNMLPAGMLKGDAAEAEDDSSDSEAWSESSDDEEMV